MNIIRGDAPSGHGSRRELQALFEDGTLGDLTDADLLRRFAAGPPASEPARRALAELVARHGAMVQRVCRGVCEEHDALDASQATFLVLIRRAHAVPLAPDATLGPWLHAVALRTARAARRAAARRASLERGLPGRGLVRPEAVADTPPQDDLAELVHEELARLPDGYRQAVVLCGLEGLTQEHAARRLGWPLGTLQSRLARGRARLRQRLERRGVGPATLAGVLTPGGPAWPESFVSQVVSSANAAGTVSAATLRLVEEVYRAMVRSQVRTTTLKAAAVLGFAALGGAASWSQVPKEPNRVAATPAPAKENKATPPRRLASPGDYLMIEVLEALPGRPVSGVRHVRPDGTISLGFYGDVHVAGLDRVQIKEKVVETLREFLADDVLGLEEIDGETGKPVKVAPARSNRVFVDDDPALNEPAQQDTQLAKMQRRLDDLQTAVAVLTRRGNAKAPDARPATPSPFDRPPEPGAVFPVRSEPEALFPVRQDAGRTLDDANADLGRETKALETISRGLVRQGRGERGARAAQTPEEEARLRQWHEVESLRAWANEANLSLETYRAKRSEYLRRHGKDATSPPGTAP